MKACTTALVLVCAVLIAASCSSSSKKTNGANTSTTTAPSSRPTGPAADVSKELSGGNGVFVASAYPFDAKTAGYNEHEYVASGIATSYNSKGAQTTNGRWTFAPSSRAPYRTRVLVRQPADSTKFSGTVIVEWLNVSGGVDTGPDFDMTHEEITRAGDAWVGVSAQSIGVEGGPVLVKVDVPGNDEAGKGLKKIDPARYGSLAHPGDAYSFDIFTQVARAARAGAGLSGLIPQHVIAAGESQSAFALTTYYNGVQPLTHAFDGFFIHSRGGKSLPLVKPGTHADLAAAITSNAPVTIFRTDQDAPVMDIQSETDLTSVIGSLPARQPDSDHFRLWEMVGTSHADARLVGDYASSLDCGVPINNGPMHIIAKAALHALVAWVADGTAPPKAGRIEVTSGAQSAIVRDSDGIAQGGIRTAPVDVPVTVLSGAPGPNPSTICLLLGSAKPLSAERIAQLYSSQQDYTDRYNTDVDNNIKAGFVLEGDKDALVKMSDPSAVKGS